MKYPVSKRTPLLTPELPPPRQSQSGSIEISLVASKSDPVNPPHYRGDTVMRIIEDFDLGFCLGNVVKYILRHKSKAGLEDLKKARWYLDREIARQEGKLDG